jgi:putative ABC transport system permease protein
MGLYRILLLLYPASFRAEYGEELYRIFSRRWRDAAGCVESLLVWFDAIIDVVLSAAVTHWDMLAQDLHYVYRTLLYSRGFAVTAIGVVALGIGATTAAYTIADHVLIRPLPFPDSNRLVKLWEDMSPGNYRQMEASPANYRDWKRLSKSFAGMATFKGISVSLVGRGQPEQLDGESVTSDLLPMLGARAVVGRLFTAEEDRPGASGTAVISYGLWQRRFAADLSVVGRRILLDGAPYVVIGVMQKDFNYPKRNLEFWTANAFRQQRLCRP